MHLQLGSNISVPACCSREKEGHIKWTTRAGIKQVGGVFFMLFTTESTHEIKKYNKHKLINFICNIICMCLTKFIQVPPVGEDNLYVH